MKRHRHTHLSMWSARCVRGRLLNEGNDLTEVLRPLEIAVDLEPVAQQLRWMKGSGAKRLEVLEVENARPKKLWPKPSWTRQCSRRNCPSQFAGGSSADVGGQQTPRMVVDQINPSCFGVVTERDLGGVDLPQIIRDLPF